VWVKNGQMVRTTTTHPLDPPRTPLGDAAAEELLINKEKYTIFSSALTPPISLQKSVAKSYAIALSK
jgi:hypothetical protein